MAEKFTDADGNEVKLITKENVEEYKNWLSATQDPAYLSAEVAPDIKLSELIPTNAYLNAKQLQTASGAIAQAMRASATPEKCAEFISLASTTDANREIIGKAWQSIGNRTDNEFHYQEIANAIKNTPDSKLIGFNLACVEHRCYTEVGQTDDGKKLTSREKELLSLLAEKPNGISAINDMVRNGSLINAKTGFKNSRKVIDEAIIKNGVNNVFANLEKEFMTKEMLRQQVRSTYHFSSKNTSAAKTQAEKNANIMPQKHTHLQEAFMYFTEKQNKYDSSNYGREKGLYERFTDLCQDMGISGELANNSVLQNIGMQIATRDVKEGNAAKLNREMLEKVIANDKSGEIASNLPDEFVEKNKGSLLKISPYLRLKDSAINNMDATWTLPAVIESKEISLALKEKILAEAQKVNAAKAPEKEVLKQNIDGYLKEMTGATSRNTANTQNINDVNDAIYKINNAFNNIRRYIKKDKDGNPIPAEEYLSAGNLGRIITGKNPKVVLPTEGNLPLNEHNTEKERRENLEKAINAFNKTVQTCMPALNKKLYDKKSSSYYTPAKEFLGDKILTDKASFWLRRSETDCRTDFDKTRDSLEQKYGRYEVKQNALEIMERTDRILADTLNNLNSLKSAMKESAHELSGVKAAEGQSKLQAVDHKLEREDKAAVRQANKAIVDPLAQKQDAKTVLKIAKQKQTSR